MPAMHFVGAANCDHGSLLGTPCRAHGGQRCPGWPSGYSGCVGWMTPFSSTIAVVDG